MSEGTVAPAEGTPAPVEGSVAAPWHGFTEPDAQAYIQNKGWTNPTDVIKSYQGVEKLIGRDPNTLLVMPRADDPEGFRGVMAKLGMPESADKYEISKPATGADDAYVDWAKQAFHKLGLTAAQAKALSAENNAFVEQRTAQMAKDYELGVQADRQALVKEWGAGHDRMLNAASAAAKSLNFSPEMVDAIEHQLGYAGTMKFFAQLGQKLGEDKFEGGDNKTPRIDGMLTPDEAKAQWEAMKLDPNLVKALQDKSHPGHKTAKEKQTRLFQVMYPS